MPKVVLANTSKQSGEESYHLGHPYKSSKSIITDAETNREVDDNGYLHVNDCVITAAEVSPYKGREIKDWERLGLDSDKIYGVFRPLSAIENAAATYNNVPLTDDHIEIRPDKPMRERVLGWTGSNARIEDGELLNDIHVFVGKGIQDIENADNYIEGKRGSQEKGKKKLSAGYGYDITLENGQFNGIPYQLRMDNLRCNHVALVEKGRIPTAGIADSAANLEDKSMKDKKARDEQGMTVAKKIMDIARDENFEGEESDRVDAILQAASELRAVQERESVHSANDSGKQVFKKENTVVKKSGMRMFLDHFLARDEKEDGKEEMDCKDKKAKDNMSILKGMKDVAMRDASEFEGGEEEKGKTLMDLANSIKDEAEEEEKEEKKEEAKDKKARDKKARDEEPEEEKKEKAEEDDKAKDMAFDALVSRKVQEALSIQNKVATLCQSVVGRLPESMLMDSNPENMIDYTLKQKGKSIDGKSLEVKLAMVEMLKTPHLSLAMDSKVAHSNTASVSIFETMKGR